VPAVRAAWGVNVHRVEKTTMLLRIIRKMWADDSGAIMATEYIFLITMLIIGTITGLTALRQAVISESVELANAIMSLSQSYSFSGQSFAGAYTAGSCAIDSPNTINVQAVSVTSPASINQLPCD
jgi:uncharacterized membrane protein